MAIKYKWTCENCRESIVTSGTRTPDALGCLYGNDGKLVDGELVYFHTWHGEEIDEPDEKSNRK